MEVKKVMLNGEEVNIVTELDPEEYDDTILVDDDMDDTMDLSEELKDLGDNNGSN